MFLIKGLRIFAMDLRVKAVIFDIDGTLYYSEKYVEHLISSMSMVLAEILRTELDEARNLLLSMREKVKTVSAGLRELGVDRRLFYDLLVEKIDPCRFIDPRPKLKEFIMKLRSRGIKTGCHTNSSRRLAEMILECIGLSVDHFDVFITCDDAEPKPDPEGYLKILEILKLKPDEVLYVGDRWEVEVEPAKLIGMKTALVSEKLEGDPDLFLSDVLELEKHLLG